LAKESTKGTDEQQPTDPTTKKDIEIISAGLHHVATLQGTNRLTEETLPHIIWNIQQDAKQGEAIAMDGAPAAAVFAASIGT
jgi:hypothetical protein